MLRKNELPRNERGKILQAVYRVSTAANPETQAMKAPMRASAAVSASQARSTTS